MSVMAVQSVRTVTANMLLSVFLVSGALADCVYNPTLFITAPQEMEALTGSCLQIPCNFSATQEQEFNSARRTYGVWLKDPSFEGKPNNVIFNSSMKANDSPITLTGDLSQKNCTSIFSRLMTSYEDEYYFRIENNPFLATASCNPVKITVKDSPPKPRIEISGDLKEKESLSVSCSASTPCPHSPPELNWNLQQPPHIMEENKDRTFTTKIQTTIVLSDEHDGFTIRCSARYPVNEGRENKTAGETKTFNVSYAPKETSVSVSPSGPVSAGSWVNLTCSSRANPPVSRYTWFKKSNGGPVRVSQGDFYRFNVTHGGVYHCEATNQLGSQTSSEILLTIEGDQQSGPVGAQVIVKTLGIVMLVSALVVFECWFRSRRSTQPQKPSTEGPDYVNSGVELPPS